MQIWHKKWLFQSEKPQNDDDKSWQIHDSQCIIRFFDSIDNPLDTENAAFKEKKKEGPLSRDSGGEFLIFGQLQIR